jgi:hypothetical protein
MRRRGAIGLTMLGLSSALILLLWARPAGAVPAFARRYGVGCSTCHSSWPALNPTGYAFKLSGYRRLNGYPMQPTTADIELALGALSIPSIPPLALEAYAGFDWQKIQRRASDGSTASQAGSSIDLNSATLFLAAPLGEHLSTFFEFPLFETKTPDNDFPNGPSGANATDVSSKRDIQFESEVPGFEKGKLMWNSLLPTTLAPPDSVNIKLGADQLPLGFSPEPNRLSIRPYLIYRRRALDLLSPTQTDDLLPNNAGDRLLRLGEPQIQIALYGLLVPFGAFTDMGKLETLSLDYEVGITNGSNVNADPNTEKDFFGHVGIRWWGQRLGFFGYYSPDIYDDHQREEASILNGGIMSGQQRANRAYALGPDLTLSLEPVAIPIWLETQLLWNRESDPTGFKKAFSWWGGFTQLNGKLSVHAKFLQWITGYARYDWLRGDRFDDLAAGGVTGVVRPREWQVVGGLQWFVLENLKIITEYSRRQFTNHESTPTHQRLIDDFFSARVAIGF